jgi:hypothetical protein
MSWRVSWRRSVGKNNSAHRSVATRTVVETRERLLLQNPVKPVWLCRHEGGSSLWPKETEVRKKKSGSRRSRSRRLRQRRAAEATDGTSLIPGDACFGSTVAMRASPALNSKFRAGDSFVVRSCSNRMRRSIRRLAIDDGGILPTFTRSSPQTNPMLRLSRRHNSPRAEALRRRRPIISC